MENSEYTTSESTCSIENRAPIDVKIGNVALLKNKPCKIVDVSVFKTGKHGDAKYHFTGIDIFTNKKYEELYMCHHNMICPIVTRTNMKLLLITPDGYCQLFNEKTLELREDLCILDKQLLEKVLLKFEQNMEICVVVQSAMNYESIIDYKEVKK